MAEVLRSLYEDEFASFMPFSELNKLNQREVEEAVAEDLDFTLRMGLNIQPGRFSVLLTDGREVGYELVTLIDTYVE